MGESGWTYSISKMRILVLRRTIITHSVKVYDFSTADANLAEEKALNKGHKLGGILLIKAV